MAPEFLHGPGAKQHDSLAVHVLHMHCRFSLFSATVPDCSVAAIYCTCTLFSLFKSSSVVSLAAVAKGSWSNPQPLTKFASGIGSEHDYGRIAWSCRPVASFGLELWQQERVVLVHRCQFVSFSNSQMAIKILTTNGSQRTVVESIVSLSLV